MTAPRLGPHERELLLAGGRLAADPAAVERLTRHPLDWEAVVFHARLHSVAPLVHANLTRLEAYEPVPPAARRRLLALHHRAEYQNRLFAEEHQAIVDGLDRAGVPVLVQKGLSVVELVYGSLGLRPLIDLIYLIPDGSLQAAAGVMAARGYGETALSPADALYRWCCPQLVFEKAAQLHVSVIFQHDLVSWPRLHALRPGGLWARARRATVAGRDVLVLSPEDFVLYLCIQADNHGHFNRTALDSVDARDLLFSPWSNNRLIRFTDVYEAIRRLGDELDWEVLASHAATGGVAGAAFTTLTLANALLGETAPRRALEGLRSHDHQRMRHFVFKSLAAPDGSRLKRMAGRGWTSRTPRMQIRLARLIGLLEVTFPGPRRLAFRYGVVSRRRLVPLALTHALRSVASSGRAFVGARPR